MRIVVFGSNGFVGSAVSAEFSNSGHTVYGGVAQDTGEGINLLDANSVKSYLSDVAPDAIVNCAGIVSGEESDFDMNVQFTVNIVKAVHAAGLTVRNIVVSGSAAEYGQVETLPVKENAPLNGKSPYAISKIREEEQAIALSGEYSIPVIIARIFNPIGPNMKEKFLIPSLIKQIGACERGDKNFIELSRLDAKRDYIDVRDIARAVRMIVEGKPQHSAYNVGSGLSTTNGRILELLLKGSKLGYSPEAKETSDSPEPLFAVQADISRLSSEFNWKPTITIEDVIKETLHAE